MKNNSMTSKLSPIVDKSNTIYDFSNTDNNGFKYRFLDSYKSPNPKIKKMGKIKIPKLNTLSIRKKYANPLEIISPGSFRSLTRAKQNMNLVKLLNIEDNVKDIFDTDKEMERLKEKLNKNTLIKMLRLGLYKKKENDEENNNKTEKKEPQSIAEKEKENEENLDKINNENREKEERIKKIFKEKLTNLEKVKDECQKLNQKINKVNSVIEECQMEVSVIVKCSDEFDEKFKNKLNNQNQNEKNISLDSDRLSIMNKNEANDKTKNKNKQFEQLNKLILYKQQRDDKRKNLMEMLDEKENIKKELEKDLVIKREQCNQVKKEVHNIRKKLLNIYHIKLYEGLDYGKEGLISIIKDIWNLGVNVDTNYMPTYLDDDSIEFLLNKANHSIEISKIRKVISDNEKEYTSYLKEWKMNSTEISTLMNNRNNMAFPNANNLQKNEMKSSYKDDDLFKTKISDISISYLDSYPRTKEFMIKYKRRHPQLFYKDIHESDFKYMKIKSLNIPVKILEKNKHIEKLKCLLNMKIEQNKQNDKLEVERLNKEFIKNQYKEKYKVNVETLFGALFGDKTNEMLNYYSKLEKEFKEGKKIIQFHTKLKIKI